MGRVARSERTKSQLRAEAKGLQRARQVTKKAPPSSFAGIKGLGVGRAIPKPKSKPKPKPKSTPARKRPLVLAPGAGYDPKRNAATTPGRKPQLTAKQLRVFARGLPVMSERSLIRDLHRTPEYGERRKLSQRTLRREVKQQLAAQAVGPLAAGLARQNDLAEKRRFRRAGYYYAGPDNPAYDKRYDVKAGGKLRPANDPRLRNPADPKLSEVSETDRLRALFIRRGGMAARELRKNDRLVRENFKLVAPAGRRGEAVAQRYNDLAVSITAANLRRRADRALSKPMKSGRSPKAQRSVASYRNALAMKKDLGDFKGLGYGERKQQADFLRAVKKAQEARRGPMETKVAGVSIDFQKPFDFVSRKARGAVGDLFDLTSKSPSFSPDLPGGDREVAAMQKRAAMNLIDYPIQAVPSIYLTGKMIKDGQADKLLDSFLNDTALGNLAQGRWSKAEGIIRENPDEIISLFLPYAGAGRVLNYGLKAARFAPGKAGRAAGRAARTGGRAKQETVVGDIPEGVSKEAVSDMRLSRDRSYSPNTFTKGAQILSDKARQNIAGFLRSRRQRLEDRRSSQSASKNATTNDRIKNLDKVIRTIDPEAVSPYRQKYMLKRIAATDNQLLENLRKVHRDEIILALNEISQELLNRRIGQRFGKGRTPKVVPLLIADLVQFLPKDESKTIASWQKRRAQLEKEHTGFGKDNPSPEEVQGSVLMETYDELLNLPKEQLDQIVPQVHEIAVGLRDLQELIEADKIDVGILKTSQEPARFIPSAIVEFGDRLQRGRGQAPTDRALAARARVKAGRAELQDVLTLIRKLETENARLGERARGARQRGGIAGPVDELSFRGSPAEALAARTDSPRDLPAREELAKLIDSDDPMVIEFWLDGPRYVYHGTTKKASDEIRRTGLLSRYDSDKDINTRKPRSDIEENAPRWLQVWTSVKPDVIAQFPNLKKADRRVVRIDVDAIRRDAVARGERLPKIGLEYTAVDFYGDKARLKAYRDKDPKTKELVDRIAGVRDGPSQVRPIEDNSFYWEQAIPAKFLSVSRPGSAFEPIITARAPGRVPGREDAGVQKLYDALLKLEQRRDAAESGSPERSDLNSRLRAFRRGIAKAQGVEDRAAVQALRDIGLTDARAREAAGRARARVKANQQAIKRAKERVKQLKKDIAKTEKATGEKYTYDFKLDGQPITVAEFEEILTSPRLAEIYGVNEAADPVFITNKLFAAEDSGNAYLPGFRDPREKYIRTGENFATGASGGGWDTVVATMRGGMTRVDAARNIQAAMDGTAFGLNASVDTMQGVNKLLDQLSTASGGSKWVAVNANRVTRLGQLVDDVSVRLGRGDDVGTGDFKMLSEAAKDAKLKDGDFAEGGLEVIVMPASVWKQYELLQGGGRLAGDKYMDALAFAQKQFKLTVLPLALTFYAGNIIENNLRVLVIGSLVNPRAWRDAAALHRAILMSDNPRELASQIFPAQLMRSVEAQGISYASERKAMQVPILGQILKGWDKISSYLRLVNEIFSETGGAMLGGKPRNVPRGLGATPYASIGPTMLAAAKAHRVAITEMREMMDDYGYLSSKALAAAAVKNVQESREYTALAYNKIQQIIGSYDGQVAGVKTAQRYFIPFLDWAKNALIFTAYTFPVKHPVLFTMLFTLETIVQEELEANENYLNSSGKEGELPMYLRQGIALPNGKRLNLTRYTPFSIGADNPLATLLDSLGGPLTGPLLVNKLGIDWTGNRIYETGGGELGVSGQINETLNLLLQGLAPGYQQAGRVVRGGGKPAGPGVTNFFKAKEGTKPTDPLNRALVLLGAPHAYDPDPSGKRKPSSEMTFEQFQQNLVSPKQKSSKKDTKSLTFREFLDFANGVK